MLYWSILLILCSVSFLAIHRKMQWLGFLSRVCALSLGIGFIWHHTQFSSALSHWALLALVSIFFSDFFGSIIQNKRRVVLFFLSLAILCYSKMLWLQVSTGLSLWLPVFVIAIAGIILLLLLPFFDKIILPTIITGLLYLQLVWAAVKTWQVDSDIFAFYALVGSVSLCLSMIPWAMYRYNIGFKSAPYWVIGFHYIAHACLIASLLR